jgi:acetylornithine deacetylase/succinyl-diaminopimelate desuccinylase-like protein
VDQKALQAALDAVVADEAVKLTRDLVDIPSPTGREGGCAEYLGDYLRQSGLETWLQPITPERANVVGALHGRGGGPTLMLNGHLDTTQYGDDLHDSALLGTPRPNDRPESFEVGPGIYGLGAVNMKGGVAACALALVALKRTGARLRGNVLVSGVSGESEKAPVQAGLHDFSGPPYQGGGFGTQYLLSHCEPVDYAIVAEPSDLYVVNAQAGYLYVKATFQGTRTSLQAVRGAHADRNAVEGAAEIVLAFRTWAAEYTGRHAYDSGLGVLEPLANIGAVDGGWPFFASQQPGKCSLFVNLRLSPALTANVALNEFAEFLEAAVHRMPGLQYGLQVFAANAPSTATPADSPLVLTAVRVMEQQLGFPTSPFGRGQANPSNDTNVFRRHGIPAIKCGPKNRTEPDADAMNRLHGGHVSRDDLVAAARFYVHMAYELCG